MDAAAESVPSSNRPCRRQRPAWLKYPSLLVVYLVHWPIIKLMTLVGRWPLALSRMIARVAGRFGDYQPGPHDVLICSYFKSGTNWAMQMAVQVAHRGRASFDHIHDLVAWPELSQRIGFAVSVEDESVWRNAPTALRVIKTHLPLGNVPYTPQARYIAVVRDPKDVFVSSFHFIRDSMLGPLMPSASRWLKTYLSADALYGSWAEHLCSYWEARDRDNVLFLVYEQMQADLPGTIRRIAQFMGVDLTSEEFDAVVRQSTFAHMKEIGHKFDPVGLSPPWAVPRGTMIRRGMPGGSGELLSVSDQQRIDEYWRGELVRLNCDFPYERAFPLAGHASN